MNTYDLISAADKAISMLESMTDEEFLAALENCEPTLAYAVNSVCRDFFSMSAINFRFSNSNLINHLLYLKLSRDVIGTPELLCPDFAMNDSYYALAA